MFNLKKFFIPNANKIYNDPTNYWNYLDDFENKIVIALSSGKLFLTKKIYLQMILILKLLKAI